MKREISAGGVVFHRKGKELEILLIKDSYGRWGLPKGHIGDTIKDETTEQAAIRECSEETGIPLKDLKIISKLGSIKYIYKLKNQRVFKIVTFYLIESSSTKLKHQAEEIKDAQWFHSGTAINRVEYANSRGVVKKAVSEILKPAVE